jgi:hypothetical protein
MLELGQKSGGNMPSFMINAFPEIDSKTIGLYWV